MKYPLIKKLGLNICDLPGYNNTEVVNAASLEKLLSKAKVVYRYADKFKWGDNLHADSPYSALLIGIQELKPKEVVVTREALAKAWDEATSHFEELSYALSSDGNSFKLLCSRLGL